LNAAFSDKQGLENQHINGGAGLFVPAVAFTARDYGADATEDLAPTMRSLARGADGHQSGSHGLAVAYPINAQLGLRGPDVSNTSRDGLGIGDETDPAYTLQANHAHGVAYSFKPGQSEAAGGIFVTEEYSPTLQAANNGSTAVPAVAFDWKMGEKARSIAINEEQSPTLGAQADRYAVLTSEPAIGWSEELTASVDLAGTLQRGGSGGRHDGVMEPTSTVRRLTPVECERLQGFPDNFTAIPWRKKGAEDCPDGPRYKALGNSMAVPVMRWIGERIRLVDDCISII
jgi:DNA (cytosine-5)-methyltransferase 1